jgi:hypothetical protein
MYLHMDLQTNRSVEAMIILHLNWALGNPLPLGSASVPKAADTGLIH